MHFAEIRQRVSANRTPMPDRVAFPRQRAGEAAPGRKLAPIREGKRGDGWIRSANAKQSARVFRWLVLRRTFGPLPARRPRSRWCIATIGSVAVTKAPRGG